MAAQVWTPYRCGLLTRPDAHPHWVIGLRSDDGQQGTHVFPAHTPHCRAAEYGLDPDDIPQLLDLILHEPHIEGEPINIYAMTAKQAWSVHSKRIKKVKANIRRIDHQHDSLAAFYDGHGVTKAVVEQLSGQVTELREHHQRLAKVKAEPDITDVIHGLPSYLPKPQRQ